MLPSLSRVKTGLMYLYSFSDDVYMNSKLYYRLANTHSSIDNQLNGIRNFRITYFGSDVKIINEYIFVPLSQKSLYSVNRSRIKEIEEISNGNFLEYYDDLINLYVSKYTKFMNEFNFHGKEVLEFNNNYGTMAARINIFNGLVKVTNS